MPFLTNQMIQLGRMSILNVEQICNESNVESISASGITLRKDDRPLCATCRFLLGEVEQDAAMAPPADDASRVHVASDAAPLL